METNIEINVLAHKGKVTRMRGCPPDQFLVWIDVEEAFSNGTTGFGVLIPASADYTQAEFRRIVKAAADKYILNSRQKHDQEKTEREKAMAKQHRLDNMADKVVAQWES